jgi:phage shock protein C
MASYCASCGVPLSAGAHFCSACGKAVNDSGAVGEAGTARPLGRLRRPLAGRKVAGVCRGLANQYGWDVTLIRVIAVLLTVLTFPVGLVAYLVLWMMMPEEPVSQTATNLETAFRPR